MSSRLEAALQEVQEWRDQREYGLRKDLEQHGKYNCLGALLISPLHQRDGYYDCFSGAVAARDILAKHGLKSQIAEGADQNSFFDYHYWLKTQSGQSIDPCPLYPLVGTNHTMRRICPELPVKIFTRIPIPIDDCYVPLRYVPHDDQSQAYLSFLSLDTISLNQLAMNMLLRNTGAFSNDYIILYRAVKIESGKVAERYEREFRVSKQKIAALRGWTNALVSLRSAKDLTNAGLLMSSNEFGYVSETVHDSTRYRRTEEFGALDRGLLEFAEQDQPFMERFVVRFVKSRLVLPKIVAASRRALERVDMKIADLAEKLDL